MKPSYLDTLKAFLEGEKDLKEWPAWWQENAELIEQNEGRTRYLKIKLYWCEGACQILERYGITYKLDESINWYRCKECGEPLFHNFPSKTREEAINDSVQNAQNQEPLEQKERKSYAIFCPNGCTSIFFN